MRRIYQLSVGFAAVGLLAGCEPDPVVPTENIPTAGVRFVHAVPDLRNVDFRFVDLVENSSHYNMPFRNATNIFYRNARAGQRTFRIFTSAPLAGTPNEGSQEIASTVVWEETVTLEAGKRYTFILWGNSTAGQAPAMQLAMMEDGQDDPGTSIAMRIVNAAITHGPLDVRGYPAGGELPAAPTWSSVAPMSASTYSVSAAGQKRINVQPAGGGTALFADALAVVGVAETIDIEATPGTTIPGSAVSNFIMPRSVAGSAAPNFTAPGMISVWDRRPPRTCQFC